MSKHKKNDPTTWLAAYIKIQLPITPHSFSHPPLYINTPKTSLKTEIRLQKNNEKEKKIEKRICLLRLHKELTFVIIFHKPKIKRRLIAVQLRLFRLVKDALLKSY